MKKYIIIGLITTTMVAIIATVVWADIRPASQAEYNILYNDYLDMNADGEARIVNVGDRYFLEWSSAGEYDSDNDTYAAVKDTVEIQAAEVIARYNQLLADSATVANELAEVRAIIATVEGQ
jgi:hypothetical protein